MKLTLKFIHTADIHLDSPLRRLEAYEGAPAEQIRQASRQAFENLIDLALDEAVDFMLIAGDLFDGDWKDYNTGLYFIKQVGRLKQAGIRVFIISGNHDAAGKMTRSLPYPDNVHLFSSAKAQTRILGDLKTAIHGQSFSKTAVSDNLAAGYPEPVPGHFNIGLLHTSLTGRTGHEPYAPCTLDDLVNKGYDYWALGHVHQFEIVALQPPVVFPGCIQGRHIRESGAKGGLLVTAQEGAPPEITQPDIDVIRWETATVDLSGATDLEAALDRVQTTLEALLEQHDPKPVVARVLFTGATDLHSRLMADPEQIKESVRATAMAHFGERAWIENVAIRTTAKTRSTADPGPLHELSALVEALQADDTELSVLAEALAGLFQKLPADYRQGETRLQPEDPAQMRDQMRDLVSQAHALLVHRLKKESAAS